MQCAEVAQAAQCVHGRIHVPRQRGFGDFGNDGRRRDSPDLERIQQLLGHAGDVAGALPALVARQQQQRADQIAALLFGALDALQTLQHLLVQAGPGQQQLGGATDHCQRRTQLMADVCIEFTVALHHFGQPRGIVVQRLGQLPHFVVGEAWRQRLGITGAAADPPSAGPTRNGAGGGVNADRYTARLVYCTSNRLPCIPRIALPDLDAPKCKLFPVDSVPVATADATCAPPTKTHAFTPFLTTAK